MTQTLTDHDPIGELGERELIALRSEIARLRAAVAGEIPPAAHVAVASLRLGDVDLAKGKLRQDARHVRTKFAQTNEVWFFPIGDDFRAIVQDWVTFLLVERH